MQLKSQFPYDLGVVENIANLFSHPKMPLFFSIFCCFTRSNGDGIHFKNITNDSKKLIRWPPRIEASYLDDGDDVDDVEESYIGDINNTYSDKYISSRIRRDSEGYVIESS